MDIVKTLNSDQKEIYDLMENENLYQFRVPTGVGKGYVMIAHILSNLDKYNTFVIASHRLSLNNQHLRDLIELIVNNNLLHKVRFLTVGSSALDLSKLLKDDPELNAKFKAQTKAINKDKKRMVDRVNKKDISKKTLSKKGVREFISDQYTTIIVSTYNSLDKLQDIDLGVLYCDEAHLLAGKDEREFQDNYNKVHSKKTFFFTATPRDMEKQYIEDDEDIFLMNNEKIFGDQYNISFKECIDKGYIIRPIIHIAFPKELKEGNYDSIENKSSFIQDTFQYHRKWFKEQSCDPNIEPKILIRCSSVPEMWDLYNYMKDSVNICAGASYNKSGAGNHVFIDKWIDNRDEFLREIQEFPEDKPLLILNYDIFSEGINVPGITSVLFLQGQLPSISKIIQNVGRGTRLHRLDRERLWKNEISPQFLANWIKPYCSVILPYWDTESERTTDRMSETIKSLRDKWNFDPSLIVSLGKDEPNGDGNQDNSGLNDLDDNRAYKVISDIENKIENLDKSSKEYTERMRLKKLDTESWFNYNNK